MKKIRYVLLTFVAFLTLNMSVKAVTLPELIITSREYKTGDKIETYELLYVNWDETKKLYAIKAYINDLAIEGMDEGWYADEVNLSGVTWSTSDESIVTVDQNGVITGVNAGDAFVIATYDDETEVAPVTVLMKAQNAPGETTPKSEEPIETIGEKQEPTVTPTENNEETKTDVKKEDKGCKLEVYEIVIIACAVVLLITLITVLVIRKKKANKETM